MMMKNKKESSLQMNINNYGYDDKIQSPNTLT